MTRYEHCGALPGRPRQDRRSHDFSKRLSATARVPGGADSGSRRMSPRVPHVSGHQPISALEQQWHCANVAEMSAVRQGLWFRLPD